MIFMSQNKVAAPCRVVARSVPCHFLKLRAFGFWILDSGNGL